MLRCLKMPLRSQLDPNMTPTWPSLGPPEGPSDLCFTMVFEHFMFRIFIVLRSLISPHGAQHRPNMGPKRAPKSAQKGVSHWPGVSLFRLRCWKALEDRFGSDLGPLLGPFGAHLGRLWGQLGAILGPPLRVVSGLSKLSPRSMICVGSSIF